MNRIRHVTLENEQNKIVICDTDDDIPLSNEINIA